MPADPPVMLSAATYDRFHDAYVALRDALSEARVYVWGVANDHSKDAQPWRIETAHGVLDRIDAALAMKAEQHISSPQGDASRLVQLLIDLDSNWREGKTLADRLAHLLDLEDERVANLLFGRSPRWTPQQ